LKAAITRTMKFVEKRPFANPDLAARKLVEIANDVETVQDGRIYIERVNAALATTSAPVSSAPSRRDGCGGMRAEPT